MTSSDLHTSSQSFDNIAIISRIIDTGMGIVASSVLIQLKNCRDPREQVLQWNLSW